MIFIIDHNHHYNNYSYVVMMISCGSSCHRRRAASGGIARCFMLSRFNHIVLLWLVVEQPL